MSNKKVLLISGIVLFTVIIIIVLLNFGPKKYDNSNKIKVVTSFYPLYFFTSEIVGDKASVINLTPAGAEPHEYEPTARDMAQIESSALLVLNGGGLESWGENIQKNINKDKTKILVIKDILNTENNNIDPHIWLSPTIALQMIDTIEYELSEIDPINSPYYKSNAKIIKDKLSILDEEFKNGLTSCKSKDIVTSHSAFAYLASAYGLNQVSIAGLSSEEEPSSKEMAEITKFAKDNNVKYIFFESLISPKLSLTIAKEIDAQTLLLNPIEGLGDDEIKSGKNYFSEMRNNLVNLKIALECK